MASGDTSFMLFVICCFTFPPLVFQAVGFFTPMWGSNSTCGSIGLVYSCCATCDNSTCKNTNGSDELDARALGLHATSLMVMFFTVLSLCCGLRIDDDQEDNIGCCSVIGGCCSLLFPVAGLFSLIGCIIVATKFSTSELGYSFYLSLTAGCLTIILTVLFCWCMCTEKEKEPDFEADLVGKTTAIKSTAGGNVVAPSKTTELKDGGEKDDVPSDSSTSKDGFEKDDVPSNSSTSKGGFQKKDDVPSNSSTSKGGFQNHDVPSNSSTSNGDFEKDDVPNNRSTSKGGGTVAPCEPKQQDITENQRVSLGPAAVDIEKLNPFFEFLKSADISKRAAVIEPPQWWKKITTNV